MDRFVLTIARALLWALVGAFVGAAPGAVRAAADGESLASAWVALAGVLAFPSILVTVLGAFAIDQLRAIALRSAASTASRVALWTSLFAPAVFVAGAVLKATTHHRGLAGATFGAFALVAGVLLWVVAWKAVRAAEPMLRRHPRVVGRAAAAILGAWLVLGSWLGLEAAFSAGVDWNTLPVRVQVASVDGSIWVAVLALGCAARTPRRLPPVARGAVAGLAIAFALDGAALWASRPDLARVVRAEAPLSVAVERAFDVW